MFNGTGWAAEEFACISIRDERIVKRLIKTTEQLAHYPDKSISQACENWADTKATYRLLDNQHLTYQKIIASHREKTINRLKNRPIILAVQDTTSLDFSHRPNIDGIGLCSYWKHSKGILVHTTMAVSTTGSPLGILDQQIWTRNPEDRGKSHNRKQLSIDDKESNKWLSGLEHGTLGIDKDTLVVTVCDREADVYDLFHKAEQLKQHFLIRSGQNRKIVEENKFLVAQIENTPSAGIATVSIPKNPAKDIDSREARLSIKFCPVTVKPPEKRRNDKSLSDLRLHAILAEEVDAAKGIEPIRWLLLTNLKINTLEEAFEKVQWYKQRWKIERFHFVLKSGCKVEELLLETYERLLNCIALYSVIAWRILWITYQSRETPEASCELCLEEHEWQALYCSAHNTNKPPIKPPTLSDAVLLIAKLGGFLARKSDGYPGVIVIWRGMQRLVDLSKMWAIAHYQNSSNDVGKA